jgi:hypothetical protein
VAESPSSAPTQEDAVADPAVHLNYARTEQDLFDRVVTCYERGRLFERG